MRDGEMERGMIGGAWWEGYMRAQAYRVNLAPEERFAPQFRLNVTAKNAVTALFVHSSCITRRSSEKTQVSCCEW
ncbi:hypothetical protein DPEC_G00286950 [Dallia pectoralis]|uniref:Uncharacterized protein n=1 Tax=Dallia pectoralis TaxID=75939 RepID=A0ACC2FK27_DALPE|nr:hypothetical protein DPEC_G00286950 [Dallia pectoralis]